MSPSAKRVINELATVADVQINGSRPWDIQVHDERFYDCVMRKDSLGLGESYMMGWWDCAALDQLFAHLLNAKLDRVVLNNKRMMLRLLVARYVNLQSIRRATMVGEQHYDIGNDLYQKMLDPWMMYTCGYWDKANNLPDAQVAKIELIIHKLGLKPSDRILDIGCGWGGFMRYAAQHYGVSAVGITISKEQAKLAQEACAGLPIEVRVQDYREINEPFDHIISIGMFEHVGPKNYRHYMEVAHRCLKDNGLFLLHTIGRGDSTLKSDDWLDKYIFPNGVIPSVAQIGTAAEKLFEMEDWHNFGPDYDKTLMAWHANFNAAWPALKGGQYDERFYRMWNYYLLSCAGIFRARLCHLWQIVFSKNGVPGGYRSVR